MLWLLGQELLLESAEVRAVDVLDVPVAGNLVCAQYALLRSVVLDPLAVEAGVAIIECVIDSIVRSFVEALIEVVVVYGELGLCSAG